MITAETLNTYKLDITRSGVHIVLAGIRIVSTFPYISLSHSRYSSSHR